MFDHQKAFNTAVTGIALQRAFASRAPRSVQCVYRAENGNKCAIGHLIPDDRYHPKMEGASIVNRPSIVSAIGASSENVDFLQAMQTYLHDNFQLNRKCWEPETFWDAVKKFAAEHNLEVPLDRQSAFDTAVKGLNNQKAFSMEAGRCAYRGNNNTKCAVGFCIPDEKYDPALESQSPRSDQVSAALGISQDPKGQNFLGQMQRQIHDGLREDIYAAWNQQKFEIAVAEFARTQNLINPLTKEQ